MNLRQGRIGNQEAIRLAILIGVTNSAFLIGRRESFQTGNQSYLSVLTGAAVSLVVFLIAARAMQRRGCGNLQELYADALGTVPAMLLGLLTSMLFVSSAALPLVRVLFTLHRYIFVDSGVDMLAIYVLIALLPLTLFGLEALGRTAKMVCVPVLAAFLLMILLGLPDYEVYRLYPLIGGGTVSLLLQTGIAVLCFLPQLMLLLICGRGVHGAGNAARLGGFATAIGGGFSVLLQLAIGMVFSYRELGRMYSPVYQLVMSVRGGWQMRLDKILLFIWVIGILLGAAALLYAASLQFCLSFRLRDVRPAGAVFSCVCTALVLLGHEPYAHVDLAVTVLLRFSGLALIGLLLLPSLFSFFRKERRLCESAV